MSSSMGKSQSHQNDGANRGSIGLVEKYFDEQAQEWSDLYQNVERVNDLVLVDRMHIAESFLCHYLTPDARVLDAGCGAGLTSLALVRKGFFVHGVDISQQMLDRFETNFSAAAISKDRYMLTHTDLVDSNLPEESFGGIVALGFLQYQPDELRALAILFKLLKPGGILVLSGPGRNALARYFGFPALINSIKDRLRGTRVFILARAFWRKLRGWDEQKSISSSDRVLIEISRHTYSLGRLRNLMKNAGFDVLQYKGHGYVGFNNRLSMKRQIALQLFFTRLSRFLPIGLWGSDLIVVARKKN